MLDFRPLFGGEEIIDYVEKIGLEKKLGNSDPVNGIIGYIWDKYDTKGGNLLEKDEVKVLIKAVLK